MAKKPTASQTTEIANYDEELAKLAGAGASLTNSSSGGRFFSTRAGVLAYDDTPLPGNQMCAIVLGHCLENIYYTDSFDADNRTPPTCFAFCKDVDNKDEMGPPPIVDKEPIFERQNETCEGCWANEWGSADKGRGKACGNRRRLALIPGGQYTKAAGRGGGFDLELFDDASHFKNAEEAYLKVPVMSGKGFDNYLKSVAEQLRKPLFAVFTRIWLEPDPKSQFKVLFELLEEVPKELIPVLLPRHRKIMEGIDFDYTPMNDDDGGDKGGGTTQRASKKLTSKGAGSGTGANSRKKR